MRPRRPEPPSNLYASMLQLLRLASVLVFVALGIALRRTPPGSAERRRRVNGLLGYVVALSLVVGVTQWDAWPFTSHTVAVGRPRVERRLCLSEIYGVDAGGREWRLDPYALMPLYDHMLQYWFERTWPVLDADGRARALRFLREKAESSRQRLAAGQGLGPQRLLGPFGAPYWWLFPRPPAPPTPFVGLRVYSACWVPSRRLVDESAVERTLRAEDRGLR